MLTPLTSDCLPRTLEKGLCPFHLGSLLCEEDSYTVYHSVSNHIVSKSLKIFVLHTYISYIIILSWASELNYLSCATDKLDGCIMLYPILWNAKVEAMLLRFSLFDSLLDLIG